MGPSGRCLEKEFLRQFDLVNVTFCVLLFGRESRGSVELVHEGRHGNWPKEKFVTDKKFGRRIL